MNQRIFTFIFCVCTVLFLFTGCTDEKETLSAFQELADRTDAAKSYAEACFGEYLTQQELDEDCVEETNSGFVASEVPIYMVGFKYSFNGSAKTYGYKIQVDDTLNCAVEEEGAQAAAILFE